MRLRGKLLIWLIIVSIVMALSLSSVAQADRYPRTLNTFGREVCFIFSIFPIFPSLSCIMENIKLISIHNNQCEQYSNFCIFDFGHIYDLSKFLYVPINISWQKDASKYWRHDGSKMSIDRGGLLYILEKFLNCSYSNIHIANHFESRSISAIFQCGEEGTCDLSRFKTDRVYYFDIIGKCTPCAMGNKQGICRNFCRYFSCIGSLLRSHGVCFHVFRLFLGNHEHSRSSSPQCKCEKSYCNSCNSDNNIAVVLCPFANTRKTLRNKFK